MRALPPALLLWAAAFLSSGCNRSGTAAAASKDKGAKTKEAELVPVRTVPLKVGRISRSIAGSGTLKGRHEVDVMTAAGGLLVEVAATKGSWVKTGQVLARIEDAAKQVGVREAAVKLREAKAKESRAELALAEHVHATSRAKLKVDDSRISLVKARLALQDAERALAAKKLLPPGSFSTDDLEKARLARDQAEQDSKRSDLGLRQAELDLTSAELKKRELDQGLTDARRDGEAAQLAADKAALDLDQTRIKAPIAGLVYERSVEPGGWVAASTVAFKIVDPSWYYLDLRLPEAELAVLACGQRALVTSPLLPGMVTGTVEQIDPAIDSKTGTVGLRIRIPDRPDRPALGWWLVDPAALLRRGMFVRAAVEVATREAARLVPPEALVHEDLAAYVFTVARGKARRVRVEIGFARESEVEIVTAALKPGDPIVVAGQKTVQDSSRVRVLP